MRNAEAQIATALLLSALFSRSAFLSHSHTRSLSLSLSTLLLAGLTAVAVGRFNGGDYSSIWVAFPFLLIAGIILCCVAVSIFGANEGTMEDFEKENQFGHAAAYGDTGGKGDQTNPTLDELAGEDLETMSIKNMKAELSLRGLSTLGMVEKREIYEALRKAREDNYNLYNNNNNIDDIKAGEEAATKRGGGEEKAKTAAKVDDVSIVMDDLD